MASLSHLKPGERGRIQVTVDVAGKRGPISKAVQVYSNDAKQPVVTLTVAMQVKDAVHQNLGYQKISSPARIFDAKCRSCHADQGRGKLGFDLFRADCLMCHSAGSGPLSMTQMKRRPASFLRRIIREGSDDLDGASQQAMPGFAWNNGGSLTDAEIESLVSSIRNP